MDKMKIASKSLALSTASALLTRVDSNRMRSTLQTTHRCDKSVHFCLIWVFTDCYLLKGIVTYPGKCRSHDRDHFTRYLARASRRTELYTPEYPYQVKKCVDVGSKFQGKQRMIGKERIRHFETREGMTRDKKY
jgi:hypothetical protein